MINGIFYNFVTCKIFYRVLSFFGLTQQGLNETGHLSSALRNQKLSSQHVNVYPFKS